MHIYIGDVAHFSEDSYMLFGFHNELLLRLLSAFNFSCKYVHSKNIQHNNLWNTIERQYSKKINWQLQNPKKIWTTTGIYFE